MIQTIKVRRGTYLAFATIGLLFVHPSLADERAKPTQEQVDFFEKRIRPIFYDNCFNCHSADNKEAGGLRVDDINALLKGGNSGAAVVPGKPNESTLIKRIRHKDDTKTMPPDYRLEEEQIRDIVKWIEDGAAWPELEIPADLNQSLHRSAISEQDIATHWAWQPLNVVSPPAADLNAATDWATNDIDRFIESQLSKNGLRPNAIANKSTLLRRITYDLTGLPPTETQLVDFLLDDSPKALEKMVDQLLESPQFGEKWGRHWLDVARYGESTGSARNLPYPHAWRYRDYVIDSFNEDKPFDIFIKEQIAGDLLPANTPSEKETQLIATGFLALGVKDVNQRFTVRYDMDNVDEQIDTVTRSVLGLTVSCARCHDHKFDPISTRDYYGLAGIFSSTELCDGLRNQMGGGGMAYYVPDRIIPLFDKQSQPQNPDIHAELEKREKAAKELRQQFIAIRDNVRQQDRGPDHAKKLQEARQAMQKAQEEVVALKDPAKHGPVALGVRDKKEIGDTNIRIRGEAEKLGPIVPRGFLEALRIVPKNEVPHDQSGRLELAKWLIHPQNALTQRVIVNRVWQHLYGDGIVRTVDNFGITGDRPTHPELLDYLAHDFVNNGWSIKKLIRKLVLSKSYQQSSDKNAESFSKDPDNRLYWRHSPRRLESEELRDTILASAQRLRLERPKQSASHSLVVRELRNNGPEAKAILDDAAASEFRSLYLPLLRTLVPSNLAPFDYVEQGMVTGKRDTTTVPTQSLFLLNAHFVRDHSVLVAQRLTKQSNSTSEELVRTAYRSILHRSPSENELKLATDFLVDYRNSIEAASQPPASKEIATEVNEASADATLSGTSSNKKAIIDNAAAPEDSRDVVAESVESRKAEPRDSNEAAVAAFVQALYASAEFRYVR
ncbi:MAG: PSD1 and planctomycete cytochrome C domain-containing protein [Pirellula sp.]|jgi:mono/diheme cytochrome c family protein|nr:PSD1 and planctomycete cytochrome C domain-containing protein [Pirellula sp.]